MTECQFLEECCPCWAGSGQKESGYCRPYPLLKVNIKSLQSILSFFLSSSSAPFFFQWQGDRQSTDTEVGVKTKRNCLFFSFLFSSLLFFPFVTLSPERSNLILGGRLE